MEHFLQKVSSQKESSQSKYDQQKRLQELQAIQLENFKLLRTVQELERKIEYLMINSQEQKIGSKQAENVRIDQLETQFNQFAEQTESILISKLSMNDPMEVEQQTSTTYIPYRKIMRCWYCKRAGHKVRDCFQFQQRQKSIIENQWENVFRIYCTQEGKIYRKKYSNQTKKLHIYSVQLINSIRNEWKSTYRKTLEKTNQKS